MLVHRPTRKIVLNLRDPARVTMVIPTAKQFAYQGAQLVAVPHRLEEVRVLRNLGFAAPSPVRAYYPWPRSLRRVPQPFEAQLETTCFLTLNPRAFVLNDMGTGKTLSVLWAWDYLRGLGHANKLLVISPLSTLERTWADEVHRNFPHLSVGVLHGSKEKRLKMLADDAYDVYVINHDGIKTIEAELIAKRSLDTVVVDEIATFRNATAQRWKVLRRVIAGRTRVWGLTGTPTPNSPLDAWAQVRLISPERVPSFAGRFKDQVLKQLGPFKWVPRESATEIVANAMQPSIRFSREECVDLPPCMVVERQVDLTPEQKTAYKEMLSQLAMEYGQQKVLAINEAVKLQKLLQIACGVVYGPGGEEVVLPCAPRIEALKEVIEQAHTKTIVFVPFKAALRYVVTELRKVYGEDAVAMVSGDVTAAHRGAIFKAFQEQDSPRVICAVADAMSHGLTLTAANTVVWYSPCHSQETYAQANARVSRPGQQHSQFIVHVEGCAAERKVYTRLAERQAMEGTLLDLIQEERE